MPILIPRSGNYRTTEDTDLTDGKYDTVIDVIDSQGQAETITLAQLYVDQWESWYFRFGDMLSQDSDTGFVALMIAMSFFENHAYFLFGNSTEGKSKRSFLKSFTEIMAPNFRSRNETKKIADWLYARARSGLFHMATIKHGIELTAELKVSFEPIYHKSGKISRVRINPYFLIDELSDYLRLRYLPELIANKQYQFHFNNGWKYFMEDHEVPVDYSTDPYFDTTSTLPTLDFSNLNPEELKDNTGGTVSSATNKPKPKP